MRLIAEYAQAHPLDGMKQADEKQKEKIDKQ
jgi:hypothetical protein